MADTFFCAKCLRHKPIAAKGEAEPGKRAHCTGCIEKIKAHVRRAKAGTSVGNYSTPLKRQRTDRALLKHLNEIGEL